MFLKIVSQLVVFLSSKIVCLRVIYMYKCGQCNATYCGETNRHLHTRIAEHRGVSSRTGKLLTSPPNSNIRDHLVSSDHPIIAENFEIIATANKYDIRIVESILIHKTKPTLNDQNSSIPLNILGFVKFG